jgi:alcohol dehydrogenase
MRALVYDSEGENRMKWTTDYPTPEVGSNQILIKTISSSLNPFDYRVTESDSMFMGYRNTPVGCDVAGTIVQIGKNVTGFHEGEKVFGWGAGLAEYAISDPSRIARIPQGQSASQFGMYPCVAVTAHQLLHKYWLSKPNFQVNAIAIIGAAGGVGTCLIQMAKEFGGPELKIFALSSHKNEEYLKSIGATHHVDYTRSGFNIGTALPEKSFDLIIDMISGTPQAPEYVEEGMRLIKPSTGKYITLNPLSSTDKLVSSLENLLNVSLRDNYDLFMVQRDNSSQDLGAIANMINSKKLKMPVAEELQFNENQLRSGFRKLIQPHHARGKFVVNVAKE